MGGYEMDNELKSVGGGVVFGVSGEIDSTQEDETTLRKSVSWKCSNVGMWPFKNEILGNKNSVYLAEFSAEFIHAGEFPSPHRKVHKVLRGINHNHQTIHVNFVPSPNNSKENPYLHSAGRTYFITCGVGHGIVDKSKVTALDIENNCWKKYDQPQQSRLGPSKVLVWPNGDIEVGLLCELHLSSRESKPTTVESALTVFPALKVVQSVFSLK
ncbi:hypothetical protein Tco_0109939 [Tanacetum coccineum]